MKQDLISFLGLNQPTKQELTPPQLPQFQSSFAHAPQLPTPQRADPVPVDSLFAPQKGQSSPSSTYHSLQAHQPRPVLLESSPRVNYSEVSTRQGDLHRHMSTDMDSVLVDAVNSVLHSAAPMFSKVSSSNHRISMPRITWTSSSLTSIGVPSCKWRK